jgi:pimeloyl-ACP methyl ester carboxylesterase
MIIELANRRVYAYTGGRPFDPSLPCWVFIHGALHDHSVWTLPARWFAHHGHSVLALDQPGHMRSSGPVCPDIPALAKWVWEVLDAVGVTSAHLVGHSLGSLIALEAAAQAPSRADQLVMVGTAYPMSVSPALLTAAEKHPAQGIEWVNRTSISNWSAKPSYPGPGFSLHGGNRALMHRVLACNRELNLFSHDFRLCDAYRGAEAAMPRVRARAHLVLGARDQMTPPKATMLLQQGLQGQVHTLATGHSVMQEDPEGFLQVLRVIGLSWRP